MWKVGKQKISLPLRIFSCFPLNLASLSYKFPFKMLENNKQILNKIKTFVANFTLFIVIVSSSFNILEILSDSAAGHLLFVLVHSMLLLPSEMLLSCFDDVCELLHRLDMLSKISPAVDVLEKQEEAWPKSGKSEVNQFFEATFEELQTPSRLLYSGSQIE